MGGRPPLVLLDFGGVYDGYFVDFARDIMDLDLIKQLLDLVRTHELAEFELEHEGIRIRVRKDAAPAARTAGAAAVGPAAAPSGAATASLRLEPPASAGSGEPAAASASPIDLTESEEVELAMVTSPIVGTFYRAPEPTAANFTDIGQTIKRGEVLCIIEAMKLMNEIESEYDGEIVRVFVESGQPVQYGERLFAIRVI